MVKVAAGLRAQFSAAAGGWPWRPPNPTRRSWSRNGRRTCAREAKVQADAQDLGKLMGAVEVTIAQKAGENDQLFGSVTAADIAAALEKQGYTIDRRKVQLDEPIKTLGDFKVTVRLHRDVSVEIPVHVVKED